MPEGSLPGTSYSSIAGRVPRPDGTDPVRLGFGEPEPPVGTRRDVSRLVSVQPALLAALREGGAVERDPADLVRAVLREPDRSVRPDGDPVRTAAGRKLHSLHAGGFPGVSRPTLGGLAPNSVNHRFPSGPAVISPGALGTVGIWYSVMAPSVVMRPILCPFSSVNQIAPSEPTVIPAGWLLGVGTTNSVIAACAVAGATTSRETSSKPTRHSPAPSKTSFLMLPHKPAMAPTSVSNFPGSAFAS